jgi:hypothetical protein
MPMLSLRRAVLVAGSLAFAAGCGGQWDGFGHPCPKPKWRKGYYASATPGTIFLGPENLGAHGSSEGNGIIYTCKAGHIDIAHLRKTADWTAFLAEKTYEKLLDDRKTFTFKLLEPSRYHVRIAYPQSWKSLSTEQKRQIAREVAIDLGQYFAYTATTWHEILTWFGYKITKVYSEFPSAFGWEDQISNLLGSHVASKAMRTTGVDFNEAVTAALDKELARLDIQPKKVAHRASQKVSGDWYSGGLYFFVIVRKRNLDIGLDDGHVTPFLIPGIEECEGAGPVSYPVPDPDVLEHGFSVSLQIEPREKVRKKILRIAHPTMPGSRIDPELHFARIMEHITRTAIEKWGFKSCMPD